MIELHKASQLVQINNKLTEIEHKVFNFALQQAMTDIYDTKGKVVDNLENPYGEIDKDEFKKAFLKAIKDKNTTFYTTFKDIKETMNISSNNNVKSALKGLRDKTIEVSNLKIKGKIWAKVGFGFLNGWKWDENEEMIQFELSSDLYFLIIQSMADSNFVFANINLAIQSKIKSKHGLWLYELGRDYINVRDDFMFDIEALKVFAGVSKNQYKATKDFIKWVIDPAIKEINEKTDIHLSYEKRKKGRSIDKLKFYVKTNNKTLILKEFMFRNFWTFLLKDIPFKTKFNGDMKILPIEKNGKMLIFNADTMKPLSVAKSKELYAYFYDKKEEFYANIYKAIGESKPQYELSENMNEELNQFFYKFKDFLSDKILKQFENYTKKLDKNQNIW